MKVKTATSVERGLLEAFDTQSGKNKNRSEFVEAAIQAYIVHRLAVKRTRETSS